MNYIISRPIKRSNLRLFLGKTYYTYKRYINWYLTRKKYAVTRSSEKLGHVVYSHHTPMIRKLQNVDMQLQYNKITNLKNACEQLNGVILKPGETFSYWRLIGKPSYRKGYLDGLILCSDGTFKAGVGGGLCQMSNLIYWMALHTPLSVIERYRHSHDIFPDVNRTQPFGTGATCVYNYFDLQIYNNTDAEYQLVVYLTENDLHGEWRCTKAPTVKYEIYEKEHSITTSIWGGYIRNNLIHRRVFNRYDEPIKDEYIAENHAVMTYTPYLPAPENSNY